MAISSSSMKMLLPTWSSSLLTPVNSGVIQYMRPDSAGCGKRVEASRNVILQVNSAPSGLITLPVHEVPEVSLLRALIEGAGSTISRPGLIS